MKPVTDLLPNEAAARLSAYKRNVQRALPGMEHMILFGSRARGDAHDDSDYDVAVIMRDLADRRDARRILSGLAYDHVLSGFYIRPIPLPADDLRSRAGRMTELAKDILRDGIEIT
jgi:predicted nucleotidyltransferase